MKIDATKQDYKELNNKVKECDGDVTIENCTGERFIGIGASNKTITINGTPGNALGAYLDGATIVVNGNAQDAVGDTMNDGKIIINGNAGDTLGYAMRGGAIYVKGNAGYRTGIHMKQYREKRPAIVVGGSVGSFLGEYLAGGLIVILGLDADGYPAQNFAGTGMHGGEIFLRCKEAPINLPVQVSARRANGEDLQRIDGYLDEYANLFGVEKEELSSQPFYLLTPNAKNPYKQLYTEN